MKAWQRQIRERKTKEEALENLFGSWWDSIDTSIEKAICKEVSFKTASTIIEPYEWLGTMAASVKHYGIFWNGICAGVVCFSQCDGWTHRTVLKYQVPLEHTWVLSRGACTHWAHPHAGSKLIACALRLLRRDTDAKIVIAYSDSNAGEIGTLYQATNWLYLGVCKRNAEGFVSPQGKKYHRNLIYDARRSDPKSKELSWSEMRNKLLSEGWSTYTISDKLRYVFPFNRSLRRRIEKDAIPYPKRAVEVSGEIRSETIAEGAGQFCDTAPGS